MTEKKQKLSREDIANMEIWHTQICLVLTIFICILFLALEEYFEKDKIIYDGSWSEWGKIK